MALMTNVLETYDPITYAGTKGYVEWEKYMTIEYDSLVKN
jgi:hypothetical protein